MLETRIGEEMDKTGILYFSGTGNTKLAAQYLSVRLKLPIHGIEESMDWSEYLGGLDRLIVLYPVYMSLPPMILRDFIKAHWEEFENKEIICIVTQMCYSGDGARVLEDFLPESAKLIDTHHLNMPHNIPNIPFVPLASKNGNRRKVTRALNKLEGIAQGLEKGEFERRHCSKFSLMIGLSQRKSAEQNEEEKKDKVWVDDKCVKCGYCVRVCPMDNFVLGEKKAVPQGNCTLCLRCENGCPVHAIRVLIDRPVEKTYPGPIYRDQKK